MWTLLGLKTDQQVQNNICSNKCICTSPLLTASRATPQPVAPPPITSTSNSSFFSESIIFCRVGNGDQAYFIWSSNAVADTFGIYKGKWNADKIKSNIPFSKQCKNNYTPPLEICIYMYLTCCTCRKDFMGNQYHYHNQATYSVLSTISVLL